MGSEVFSLLQGFNTQLCMLQLCRVDDEKRVDIPFLV